jgi:PAS domain S-box-containing protein
MAQLLASPVSLMSTRSRVPQDAASASEYVARLEREVAELRRQLTMLYSQASDRFVTAPSNEEEFFYSEARYRALIELSPQLVWINDHDGNNKYCNHYWYEYSGLTLEETVGSGWAAALHPEDRARTAAERQQALANGTGYEAELRFRRARDGQFRWHLCRVLAFRDAGGKITKWQGVALDIHERKVAAAAIAEANERMQLAVESASAGTWDFYPATNKLECTEHCCKIFQLAPGAEPSLELFYERIHPKDRSRVQQLLEQAMDPQGPGEYDADYRIVWPDGTTRWIFAKGRCFFSGDGKARQPVRLSGLLVDVTERRQTQRDRDSLAATLKDSPDFIGITDLKGRVLFLNRAGQQLVGLKDDKEARTKTAFDFLGAPERDILVREILPMVREGKVWEREFVMRHFVTGEPILVETRVFGIFDENGRLTSMANLSRDISQKKKLDEQLRLAQKMEAVGRLAGGVAHDFNNLLTVIRGSAEVLEEHCRHNEASLKLVEEINSAAERAAALTQQLLAFGRQQMVRPRSMNLNAAVLRLRDMLQRLVGEDITLDLRPDESLSNVKMDPIQADQILINLAANARDAMPYGGTITIRTFNLEVSPEAPDPAGLEPGGYACLRFSDNGRGMTQETMSHIFEPFFTTKKPGEGNGLGLCIVYGIVQQSDGEVLVWSRPNEGACFTLYLPATMEEVSPEPAVPEPKSLGDPRTILLVEDEPSLRAILSAYMREHGYHVYEAANAREASQVCGEKPIDLMITDIVMPGPSGSTLASSLAAAHPSMPVIFMSGYADHAALKDVLALPYALFLQKPFRFAELLGKVREALGRSPESP